MKFLNINCFHLDSPVEDSGYIQDPPECYGNSIWGDLLDNLLEKPTNGTS